MRKALRLYAGVAAILAAVGLGVAPHVAAQFGGNTLTINSAASGSNPSIRAEGLDANIGISIVPKGTGSLNFGSAAISGGALSGTTLTLSSTGTAKSYFIRAVDHCRADSANILTTRLATGDWALTRTAAGAETYIFTCHVPIGVFISTASKGVRPDSFSIAHFIGTAALTAATFTQHSQVVYANAVANAVTAQGGAVTVTMPTAAQATPYLTAATLGTPAFVNPSTNAALNIEYTVTMQNTGVYRLYGIVYNFTEALY